MNAGEEGSSTGVISDERTVLLNENVSVCGNFITQNTNSLKKDLVLSVDILLMILLVS